MVYVALNFWLVVFLVDKILARGRSWWFVVARGGSCVVLDLTVNQLTVSITLN